MIRFLSPLKKREGSDVNTTACHPGSMTEKFASRRLSFLLDKPRRIAPSVLDAKHTATLLNGWKMPQGFAARTNAATACRIYQREKRIKRRSPHSFEGKRMKGSLSANFTSEQT